MIWRKRSLSVVLFLLFGALSGPAPAAAIPDPLKPLHVISRLGFGSDPGQVEKIQTMGIEKYIAAQLAPDSIPESDKLTRQLNELKTLGLNPAQLFQEYGPPRAMRGQKPDPEAIKAARERARAIVQEAARARLLRAIESPRQLQEVMVDFWFNHFNVFADKGLDQLWVGAYEREAIRPFALGRFYDLLSATAHHPAMLFYLDNWQNTAPNSPGARGKLQGVNENYARELMELHTLGVNGGYSQADVIALAHLLTGWGLVRGGAAIAMTRPFPGGPLSPEAAAFSGDRFGRFGFGHWRRRQRAHRILAGAVSESTLAPSLSRDRAGEGDRGREQ